jgi:hypothetical protein
LLQDVGDLRVLGRQGAWLYDCGETPARAATCYSLFCAHRTVAPFRAAGFRLRTIGVTVMARHGATAPGPERSPPTDSPSQHPRSISYPSYRRASPGERLKYASKVREADSRVEALGKPQSFRPLTPSPPGSERLAPGTPLIRARMPVIPQRPSFPRREWLRSDPPGKATVLRLCGYMAVWLPLPRQHGG